MHCERLCSASKVLKFLPLRVMKKKDGNPQGSGSQTFLKEVSLLITRIQKKIEFFLGFLQLQWIRSQSSEGIRKFPRAFWKVQNLNFFDIFFLWVHDATDHPKFQPQQHHELEWIRFFGIVSGQLRPYLSIISYGLLIPIDTYMFLDVSAV